MYILVCLGAYLLFHRINDNEMRLLKTDILIEMLDKTGLHAFLRFSDTFYSMVVIILTTRWRFNKLKFWLLDGGSFSTFSDREMKPISLPK